MAHLLPADELSVDISPRDDLWRWVNEEWVRTGPIPADRARYGLSDAKRARVAAELLDLVRDAGDTPVGRLYRMALDGDRREAIGLRPIADELARIAATQAPADILRVWGELQREGVTGPFQVHVLPREDEATRWQVSLYQAGTTLPAAAMTGPSGDALRRHAHVLGEAAGWSAKRVGAALDLEWRIARVAWARPDGVRDADLVNPLTWAQMSALEPYVEGLRVPAGQCQDDSVWNICQPSYLEGLTTLLRELPTEQWRDYLSWRVLCDRAPLLTPGLDDADALFHDCAMGGQPEPAPSWRRAVTLVQSTLPTDLARLWVERHLTADARDRTRALGEALRARLRRTLTGCAWLGTEATEVAVAKLDAVVLNVGWPDVWESDGAVDAGDLCAVVRHARAVQHDRIMKRLGGPVDRTLWGPPPFTVNTFYHPFYNQVLIEGASLPPLAAFEDPAVLLGQYGSIIGHELGHAFDSRGAARDDRGRLRSWWGPSEQQAFDARVRAVEAQVDGHRPRGVDDTGVVGGLVGFECVAELIGIQLAWDTYVATSTAAERAERRYGLTGPQRFFVAKAYGRRALDRPATARLRLASDVHPPFEVFANLARNLDAFHDAFGTEPGDGMWLAPSDRVRVF